MRKRSEETAGAGPEVKTPGPSDDSEEEARDRLDSEEKAMGTHCPQEAIPRQDEGHNGAKKGVGDRTNSPDPLFLPGPENGGPERRA
jgi:hypothetical protein